MAALVRRATLIVLDSVGCGDAPDAALYGDEGADTLGHIGQAVGGLRLPHLGAMGLGSISSIEGVPPAEHAAAAYGRLTEVSAGKDTTTGHWELAGVVTERPFPVYPTGFPPPLVAAFEARVGRKILGNYPASGTEIVEALGAEHVRTGRPIVYTSADSVFQIAAHEGIIPIAELYAMCEAARELLTGEHAVGRVIARPFAGEVGKFYRTERRKDFSLVPPQETILDAVKASGQEAAGIGKIEDIFAHRGLTRSDHTANNMAGIDSIVRHLREDFAGFVFVNLVDFDSLYGHRSNVRGYADALEAFDARLPEILDALKTDDVLMITADHGNDPTDISTDHTRERVPILVYGTPIRAGFDLGTRSTFADVAATLAELLSVPWHGAGTSFADAILCR